MYNKAILIGRLVADPELKTTPQGINVCSFRIAVDRPYTPKGAEKKSDFITIVCWRQNAEFVSKYFTKGRLIGTEGSIQTRDYTDKDGNKRYVTEIVADRCFFVDSKNTAGVSVNEGSHPEPSMGGVSYSSGSGGDFQIVDDDDLPF
ncbi:MAG: single-stranded DNA-binding protein [Oscillospiraceae bacterium]